MEEEMEIKEEYNLIIINNIKGNFARLNTILEKITSNIIIDYLLLTGEVFNSELKLEQLNTISFNKTIIIFDSSEAGESIRKKYEYSTYEYNNIIILGKSGILSLKDSFITIAYLNGAEIKEFLNINNTENNQPFAYKYFKYNDIKKLINNYQIMKNNQHAMAGDGGKIDFFLVNSFPQCYYNRYFDKIKENSKKENLILNEEQISNNISYTLNYLLYIMNPRYIISSVDDFFFKNTNDIIINKQNFRTFFYHLGYLEDKTNMEQIFYIGLNYKSMNTMNDNQIILLEKEHEQKMEKKFINDDNLFKYFSNYQIDINKSLVDNFDMYLKLCYERIKCINDIEKEVKTLYLTNINYNVTEDELRQYLTKTYGSIRSLKYMINKETNKFNGKAFVLFNSIKSMENMLNNSYKEKFHDRNIKAVISVISSPKPINNTININNHNDINNSNNNIVSNNIDNNSECWFCYKNLDKNYILGEFDYNYLTLSKGPINEYHFLIIPKRHISFYNNLNDSEKKECEMIINMVNNYLSNKKMNLIIYEKNLKYNFKNSVHLLINIVGFDANLIQNLNLFSEYFLINEKILNYKVIYNEKNLYLYTSNEEGESEYVYLNIPFNYNNYLIRKIFIMKINEYKIDIPRKLICLLINKQERINWKDTLNFGQEFLDSIKPEFSTFLNSYFKKQNN